RPGAPIRSQDVRPALLVRRGQMVLLTVGQGGFMISARLEAMQDGRMGEQIQLRNRESGRIMTGVVKGPNQALGV
ncbi:MAG: flagellar basal body P-ring formation chaperone FlgA, partial [Limnohabitans sp.]